MSRGCVTPALYHPYLRFILGHLLIRSKFSSHVSSFDTHPTLSRISPGLLITYRPAQPHLLLHLPTSHLITVSRRVITLSSAWHLPPLRSTSSLLPVLHMPIHCSLMQTAIQCSRSVHAMLPLVQCSRITIVYAYLPCICTYSCRGQLVV